jgi:hypothetical protein
MRNSPYLFVACAALLLTCGTSPKITGTGSETDTAMIYNPDNTPAVGAVVRFFVSSDSTRAIAYQTKTDANGRYSTKGLVKGMYNMLAYSAKGLVKGAPKMLAANDSLMVYQDSILVLQDTVLVQPDTLEKPGSITGIIGLQPNHDPRTATVQVLGTDLYTNVNINGRFTLSPVARGSYNLRLVTTLADYTPTYVTIHTQGQKKDTLADTLWLLYTGIPVVTGLAATYDTANGVVHLSWNKVSYRDFQDYLVFRDAYDSIVLSTNPIAARGDTFFVDSIYKRNSGTVQFSFSDTNDYHFKYRICVEDNSGNRGYTYKYVDIVAVSPLKIGPFKLATKSAGFGGRHEHSSVVFNNKMWLIAGDASNIIYVVNTLSDVWYSGDGISWLPATQQAAFPSRRQHTSLVYNNEMWVIGGWSYTYDSTGMGRSNIMNNIWFSADGVTWTESTPAAAFSARYGHSSVVFDNKMWVMGGDTNKDQPTPTNDVWNSSDGVTWTQVTANAGFSPRCCHSSVVFDNKMWVMGGDTNKDSPTPTNDVWNSTDGVTWTQVTANAGFSPRYGHSSVVFDNKMWVIAGESNSGGERSDAWCSTDGITWIQAAQTCGFFPRTAHSSLVFDNKIWVIGGQTEGGSDYFTSYSDVWYSDSSLK